MPELGLIVRAAAVMVAGGLLAAALGGAAAQTLTDPHPRSKSPPAAPAAKSHPAASASRLKTCAAYGAGFAEVPGTGACIKIGGFVDGTVSAGH